MAEEEHISTGQFITTALAEKISTLTTEKYLNERLRKYPAENPRSVIAWSDDT